MDELAPWMHQFRFSDRALVGFYKFSGLDWDHTWCNQHSDPARIERMVAAYDSIEHGTFKAFMAHLFDKLDLPNRNGATVIDLSSATGKNSFIAADHGFGRVVSSEIRQISVEQQKLILACTDSPVYRERIEAVHDPVSADAPEFPSRYQGYDADVVMSIGLIYHLVNPVQHLLNLHSMTRRYVILHTMTHDIRSATDAWRLLLEERDTLTKATSGISWTPHFYGLIKLIKEVGFRKCKIHYPEPYARNHPNYKTGYVPASGRIRDQILARIGIRTDAARERERYLSSFDPVYYKKLDVMPGNFFYVLER